MRYAREWPRSFASCLTSRIGAVRCGVVLVARAGPRCRRGRWSPTYAEGEDRPHGTVKILRVRFVYIGSVGRMSGKPGGVAFSPFHSSRHFQRFRGFPLALGDEVDQYSEYSIHRRLTSNSYIEVLQHRRVIFNPKKIPFLENHVPQIDLRNLP